MDETESERFKETESEKLERGKLERKTWDEQIQPVLDECDVSVQGYKFYKLKYSPSKRQLYNRQFYIFERRMDAECVSLNAVPDRRLVHPGETTFRDLLEYLHDRRPEDIRSVYRDFFWRFFKILHAEELLPYFLEYLRRYPLPWAQEQSNQSLERQEAGKLSPVQ